MLPFLILALGLAFMATNVPVQDDYDSILAYLNGSEHLKHIADFHNEHRIVTSRLVCEIVYRILGHIDFRILIWIGNIGWWAFVALFAHLFTHKGESTRLGSILTCWMLVGFYDHENIFLSMSSMANHWVLAFAFAACIAFSKRSKAKWFAISMLMAILATFTSGGGLLIFPALILMAGIDCFFASERHFNKRTFMSCIVFVMTMMTVYIVYFQGFPHGDASSISHQGSFHRIVMTTGFFFCFFGNLMPTPVCALPLGIAIVIWGLIVCRYVSRYRGVSLAIFAFLAFCVANILAATLFRGTNIGNALPGRYRLVSSAIIVSLCYLTLGDLPLSEHLKRKFLSIAITCCIILSTIYAIRGFSYNIAHRKSLETGISQWPESDEGLDYPSEHSRRIHASTILRESVSKGIYRP